MLHSGAEILELLRNGPTLGLYRLGVERGWVWPVGRFSHQDVLRELGVVWDGIVPFVFPARMRSSGDVRVEVCGAGTRGIPFSLCDSWRALRNDLASFSSDEDVCLLLAAEIEVRILKRIGFLADKA